MPAGNTHTQLLKTNVSALSWVFGGACFIYKLRLFHVHCTKMSCEITSRALHSICVSLCKLARTNQPMIIVINDTDIKILYCLPASAIFSRHRPPISEDDPFGSIQSYDSRISMMRKKHDREPGNFF